MKASVVAPIMVIALVLPGAGASRASHSTACIDIVRYRGVLYEGTMLHARMPETVTRVRAVRPGCNDTPGASKPDTPVTLARIRSIPPRIALVAPGRRRHVYLSAGVFPQNPRHPLHDRIYGEAQRPDECRGLELRRLVLLGGVVTETPLPFSGLTFRGSGGEVSVFVDARTTFAFPWRRRLTKGMRVAVTAADCRAKTSTVRKLVARRIRATG